MENLASLDWDKALQVRSWSMVFSLHLNGQSVASQMSQLRSKAAHKVQSNFDHQIP